MTFATSLRSRLLLAMLSIFALGVLATLVSYHVEVNGFVRDIEAKTLQTQASDLLNAVRKSADGQISVDLPKEWKHAYENPTKQFAFTILDLQGRPLLRSSNLEHPLPALAWNATGDEMPIAYVGAGADRRVALQMRAKTGIVAVVSRGDISPDALADSLFQEEAEQVLVLVPFVLLAVVVMWFISAWSLRPLDRASGEAARVSPSNADLRISTTRMPREIQPLIRAVNGALDRLAQAYAAERRLTADAAHELRTPVAVLNLRLQRARTSGKLDWEIIERELGQVSRVIAQLLDLTRKEAHSRDELVAIHPMVNLSRVIREASASLVPLADAQQRTIAVELPVTAFVRGDEDHLRDLFRNLIENAITHGRGNISIRLEKQEHQQQWIIDVADEGEGVPTGYENLVFERFRKLHPGSSGAGLGLAIVRQVALNHGGRAAFLSRRGVVRVELPAIFPASAKNRAE